MEAASVMTLSGPERDRLAELLGVLGSDHDGERAGARLLATRMLKDNGLTWADLIGSLSFSRQSHGCRSGPAYGWRDAVEACGSKTSLLNPWEQQFLSSVAHCHRLSEKQLAVLDRIRLKLGVRQV
jgi:hypothetical protein